MKVNVLIASLLMVLFVPHVFAASISVVGSINNGDPTTYHSQVVFENTSSKQAITGAVDQMGKYTVFVPPGSYDITVIPPVGSKLSRITESNQKIEANSVQNISVPTTSQQQTIPAPFRSVNLLLLILLVVCIGGVMLFALRKKRQ